MIDKEKLAELAKKYLDGKATPAEKDFLEAWYNSMDSGKSIDTLFNEMQAGDLKAEMFNNIQSDIKVRPIHPRKKYLRYAAVAAGILAVVLTSVLLMYRTSPSEKEKPSLAITDIETDSLRKIQLIDGTLVWLNAGSKLHYATDFGQHLREIFLEGEAYFEVKSDKEHPFLVHTQGLTTRVLGTKFNVKAYNPKAIEVTLVEGKVMLTAARATAKTGVTTMDTLFLAPNEKALFAGDKLRSDITGSSPTIKHPSSANDTHLTTTSLSKHMVANALAVTSWRTGELEFDHEPLSSVLETFNRKLHVTIKAAPELEDQTVTLKVTDEPLDEILFEITRQIKRTRTVGGKQVRESTQYKKQGSEYYIE
ncbi:MAG: FecR domain-containing protein [Chitinophagaceae bacterium]|nr:FecR domain-containing protein [Chitinophagaceae bacterium]